MQKAALRTFAPLLAATFIAYGYNNAFMALMPTFVVSRGGSLAEAGIQGTVFLLTAVILRFYFGPLADRSGNKLVMAIGVGSFFAAAVLLVFCTEFWQILLVRCLQAIGLSGFFPCATAAVVAAAPPNRRGTYIGIYRFVFSASLLLWPLGAFFIVDVGSYEVFFVVAALCAAGAVLAVCALPGKKVVIRPSSQRKGIVAIFREAIGSHPRFVAFVIGAAFAAAFAYGLLFGFSALYLESIGLGEQSGFFFTLVGLGGLAANPVVGWVSDKADQKKLLAFCLLCLGAGIVVLGALSVQPLLFPASGILSGLGYAGSITTIITLISARIEEEHRSSVLSLQQNAVDLGIAIASGVFGMLIAAMGSIAPVLVGEGTLAVFCALVVFAIALRTGRKAHAAD